MLKQWFQRIRQHLLQSQAQKPVPEIPAEAELILYKFDACPFCRRVMKKVKELQLNIEYKDTKNSPQNRQDLYQIGGKTQVPCLLINGQPLYESKDINHALQIYADRLSSPSKSA